MKTAAIIPGWTEGTATFKKFSSCLNRAGFSSNPSVKNSTVLITHSAGCFFIPPDFDGKLIIMIDPAYGPNKRIAFRQFRVIILDAPKQIKQWGFETWLKQRFLNALYLFGNPGRSILIFKLLRRDEINLPRNTKVILVDNLGDRDHKAIFRRIEKVNPSAELVELPGLHEDCLVNPQPYIDLLLKEL